MVAIIAIVRCTDFLGIIAMIFSNTRSGGTAVALAVACLAAAGYHLQPRAAQHGHGGGVEHHAPTAAQPHLGAAGLERGGAQLARSQARGSKMREQSCLFLPHAQK